MKSPSAVIVAAGFVLVLVAGILSATPPGRASSEARSVAVARALLLGLEALDIDAALTNFADDGVQEMPFAPEGFPSRLDGKDALYRQYSGLPDAYDSMQFEIRTAHALDDPQWAVLEYHGTIRQMNGESYDNDYIGVFQVIDDKIVLFREYFNPIVLQRAFGDNLADTFGVQPS